MQHKGILGKIAVYLSCHLKELKDSLTNIENGKYLELFKVQINIFQI